MVFEVYNINQEIRRGLIEEFASERSNKGYIEYLEYMADLEENNFSLYKTILMSLYPIFYLENLLDSIENENEREYIDYCEDDSSCFFYDEEEFSDITNIDDVIAFATDNPVFLISLLDKNCCFDSSNFLEKRSLLFDFSCYDSYLSKISPIYILDKLDCCYDITGDVLENMYNSFYQNSEEVDELSRRAFSYSKLFDFIYDLSIFDVDSFNSLMDEISKDSYLYINYLNSKGNANKQDKRFCCLMENENSDTINMEILRDEELTINLIDKYFTFKNLDDSMKDNIKSSIENIKLLKKEKDK